jgi:osmotically-inducible protein OsmY
MTFKSELRGAAMKSDSQLRADVLEELKWEPSIDESEVGVVAKDGVVTLTGYVESYAQKYAAERAAERVSGVRAIAYDTTRAVEPLERTGEWERGELPEAYPTAL